MEAELGLTRKSQFGFAPPARGQSAYTVRMVPLTQGVNLSTPWPVLPPGSSTSMTNFLPLDGKLIPRSRLSSLNTVASVGSITGMATLNLTPSGLMTPWVSGQTLHGRVASSFPGGISLASFTSAFGLGVGSLSAQAAWDYAQTYLATIDDNALVLAGQSSHDTLLVLYHPASGLTRVSYLTSAPKAKSVTAFDNYIVALNIKVGNGNPFSSRVQWPQRGNPSNWTGEGSGFEDLLDMRGAGIAIRTLGGRLIVFTELETWQGVGATYPQQFSFSQLDPNVGCPFLRTIQDSDFGLIFLGTDLALRILPREGGLSQPISAAVSDLLRYNLRTAFPLETWGVYDPLTKIYHLFFINWTDHVPRGLVVNVQTGEWGFADYVSPPGAGTTATIFNSVFRVEGLRFGNSAGTVFSTNSLLADDSGSVVTSKWRSAPIASDLPGNWKQLVNVNLDYRATSKSTVTLKISTDGGNTYESTGALMSLASAPVSGRASLDVYQGGAFPAIELTSQSTGYELHRIDATLQLGGRR